MQTTWQAGVSFPEYPSLSKDIRTDVLVAGGGLAGLLSAYALASEGKKVVVCEARRIGEGATAQTTAFLTQAIDTNADDLVRMFGRRTARAVWESHGAAIDYIADIIEREGIDCGFMRCPAYVYGTTKAQATAVDNEYLAAREMGFPVSLCEEMPFATTHCMQVLMQAKFHPLQFLRGLCDALRRMDVRIYEHTPVSAIIGEGPLFGLAKGFVIRAQDVVTATYWPLQNPTATHWKKGMYLSSVIEAHIPKGLLPEAIYMDKANPYNYFRIDSGDTHDVLMLGGADYRYELPVSAEKSYQALEDVLQRVLGSVPYVIHRKWQGPIIEQADGLALIGRVAPHRYVATGFSGNGMTYAAMSAMMMADMVVGRVNAWEAIYDPARRMPLPRLVSKAADYIEELFGGAVKNTVKYAG